MLDVLANEQGLVEKHLFAFCVSNLVFLPVLLFVPFIPIKPDEIIEVKHLILHRELVYILIQYVSVIVKVAEHILALFQHYQIHDMLYLGGNDSAETSNRLAQAAQKQGYDLRVVSVPKTIDNDLPYTDHCPGYGTAARFIALATMHATMNMLALPKEYPVKFIETMGRDAGWLVAASALGKREEHDSPHLLLCPEHAFNEDAFLKQVETIYQQLGYVVIVSSEALRDEKGQPVGALVETDAFGHTMVSGVAERLTEIVRDTLHLRASFDRPGDIQWNGISRTDSDEAYMVGQAAVRALLEGKSDLMVTLVREEGPAYRCTTGSIELSKVADQQRLLPDTFLNESKTMITRSFYDYALPLLGDPLPNYPKFEMIKAVP